MVSNSLQPHGLYSPWNSPGQNTGAGSCSLLQCIFPTQGLNPGLPHFRWILYQLSHHGSPLTSFFFLSFLPFFFFSFFLTPKMWEWYVTHFLSSKEFLSRVTDSQIWSRSWTWSKKGGLPEKWKVWQQNALETENTRLFSWETRFRARAGPILD